MHTPLILFDGPWHTRLKPFTFLRPVATLRVGILTIAEKFEKWTGEPVNMLGQDYMAGKYHQFDTHKSLMIAGNVLPNEQLIDWLHVIQDGEVLVSRSGAVLAFIAESEEVALLQEDPDKVIELAEKRTEIVYTQDLHSIEHVWDIFKMNGAAIESDFLLITKGRKSADIPASNYVRFPERIFLEEGATVENASLNAKGGYIYMAKDSEIYEGAMIRGSLALCDHAEVKLGAKIYGPTTIGPHCKVGGEVSNSIFQAYSNKGHDGFLGNSVLGEWCNLGADTNTSNLKNNYEKVKLWSYETKNFAPTGEQFIGLMMGDHSKCGINTMFNTGTVVGVSANIYGAGFPRNFLPSFTWGGASGTTQFRIDKAIETAQAMMGRRQLAMEPEDLNIFKTVYNRCGEEG